MHGLESKVCPECGEDITPRTIRYGTRHPIRWQIITASVCLAFAFTGLSLHLTGVAQRIDWYRAWPTGWLVSAAESGNRNALAEIDRRLNAPKVNASDFRAAVDAGLRVQKNRPPAADLQAWLNLLSKLESTGCMTSQQRDQFFSRIVEFSIIARPKVRQGDPLAYSIEMVIRAPNTGALILRFDAKEARLGGRVVSDGGGSMESTNYTGVPLGDRQTSTRSVPTSSIAPGDVELAVSVCFGLRAVGVSASGGKPLWTRDITMSAPVNILPPEAPDLINRLTAKSLADKWQSALLIDQISFEYKSGADTPTASLNILTGSPLPASAKFDVLLEVSGKRERWTGLLIRVPLKSFSNFGVGGSTWLPLLDNPVRIILRGSREAALSEPDIDEYLDEDIDLGEFRLTRDPARPTAAGKYERARRQ